MRVGRNRRVGKGEKEMERACTRALLSLLLAAFLAFLPFYHYSLELEQKNLQLSQLETEPIIVPLFSDAEVSENEQGKLVHITSNNIKPSELLYDNEFNVAFQQAVKLKRVVEYCQWEQFYKDTTYNKGQSDEYTERTYYYIKGWHRHRIISVLFDQPFAHNNPQRDPFPAGSQQVNSCNVGSYILPGNLIEAKLNNFNSAVSYDQQQLQAQSQSIAAMPENGAFRFIGNGWFYSPYESSTLEKFFMAAGGFAEGSLLDYQIGDLFSTCKAGDIRTKFEVVAPTSLSVIAKQVDAVGTLGYWTTTFEYQLALVQEGIHMIDDMFAKALADNKWKIYISRVVLLLWGAITSAFIMQNKEYSWPVFFFQALCLSCAVWSTIYVYLWGIAYNLFVALVVIISFTGASVTFSNAPFKSTMHLPPRKHVSKAD